MSMLQPPNGFAGAAQQTPAVRLGIARAAGRGRVGGKRSKPKKKAAAKSARRSPKKSKGAPKKGSTAMKRKMAKLRAARRGK